jgi:protein-disulfide isomerase
MNAYKKLILALIIAIALTVLILIYQLSATGKISVNRAERPLIETTATDMPIDPADPIYGNRGAAITVTEFIDLNSAASRRAHQTIVAFIKDNPQKIRLLLKDFPAGGFFVSDNYRPHIAANCVLKQDATKFFSYIDELSAPGVDIRKEKTLGDLAVKIGLNQNSWTTCLNSTEAKTRIETSVSLAKSLGLKKAPEIYINNKKVNYLDEINLTDLLKEIVKEY